MGNRARRRPWRGVFSNLDFVIDLMIATATIIISLGTFIYSIVGKASPAVISSGTLAILGLLGYSVLRNRQTDQTIKLSLDDLAHALPARSLAAYAQREAAYKDLETYVATRRVRRAVLIQYSGTMCMDLVKALLSSGAHVTLYLQHEETAKLVGSAEQQDRITARRRWLRGELAGEYDLSKLGATPLSRASLAARGEHHHQGTIGALHGMVYLRGCGGDRAVTAPGLP